MIEKVYKACPVCRGHVRGSKDLKYYCDDCSLLFDKKDLIVTKEHLERFTKKRIIRKMNRDLLRKVYD